MDSKDREAEKESTGSPWNPQETKYFHLQRIILLHFQISY